MSSMFQLLSSLNSFISLLLGIPLNLFLCFLIFRRSSPEIRVYRMLLLQTSVTDIVLLITTELAQPVIVLTDTGTEFYISLVGSLGEILSNPYSFVLYAFWFFALNFSIMGLTVQFLYRYFVICSKKLMAHSYALYFRTLTAFTSILFLLMFAIYWAFYPPPSKQQIELPEANGTLSHVAFYSYLYQPSTIVVTLLYLMASNICYVIIIACYLKIRKFLLQNMNLNKREDRKKLMANKQLSLMLMLQCALPIFCMSLLIGICVLLLLNIDWLLLKQLELLAFLPLNWLPLLNPLVTMLTVKDYRRFLGQIVRLHWPVATISQTNVNNNNSIRVLPIVNSYVSTGTK